MCQTLEVGRLPTMVWTEYDFVMADRSTLLTPTTFFSENNRFLVKKSVFNRFLAAKTLVDHLPRGKILRWIKIWGPMHSMSTFTPKKPAVVPQNAFVCLLEAYLPLTMA